MDLPSVQIAAELRDVQGRIQANANNAKRLQQMADDRYASLVPREKARRALRETETIAVELGQELGQLTARGKQAREREEAQAAAAMARWLR